jgi:hypothetical protein
MPRIPFPHRSRVTSREPIFGCLAGFEHGFRVIDADDRPLIAQWAAKSHHQTRSRALKGLDIQSTPALHVAYLGRTASNG